MSKGQPLLAIAQDVLQETPCSITLPAGSGKTELIAAMVAQVATQGGTSLVLTHTHAGVNALRQRMKKFGVSNDRVVVRTLDSWSYDLVSHFPILAELDVPATPDWSRTADYHRGAARAVESKAVSRMLSISYAHVFIDEYQDCVTAQHILAVALAQVLPITVLGDPLQSLFHFGKNRPVDWNTDVLPNFPAINVDHHPHRWEPNHQDLGAWLVSIRENLVQGVPIDLTTGPVRWVERQNPQTFVNECYRALSREGTVAALGHFRPDCVRAASMLKGSYSVMEAIDEKLSTALSAKIDTDKGSVVAKAVVDFAIDASIGLASHISPAKRKQLGVGKSFTTRNDQLKPAYKAVLQLRDDPTPTNVHTALSLLGRLPNVIIHCREAWDEITQAVAIAMTDDCTVSEALQRTRNYARVAGRRSVAHVVSRPLLVKGLEYDHVIILNPAKYSAEELYVALTRGSQSVTVISDAPLLETSPVKYQPRP